MLPLAFADRFEVYRPAQLTLAAGDRVRVTANDITKGGKHKLRNGALFAGMQAGHAEHHVPRPVKRRGPHSRSPFCAPPVPAIRHPSSRPAPPRAAATPATAAGPARPAPEGSPGGR